VALGAVSRALPIPALAVHEIGFNHLKRRDAARIVGVVKPPMALR
jgi:hypothetical protein